MRDFGDPKVAKTGQTTGKTFGYVVDFSFDFHYWGTKVIHDQLLIGFDPNATRAAGGNATIFADEGDSGAPLMRAAVYDDPKKDGRELVGVMSGAVRANGWGVASRIENVFSKLDVSLA